MGNAATYEIVFNVTLDGNDFKDIKFLLLSKTWDNFNAVYFPGNSEEPSGTPDGF